MRLMFRRVLLAKKKCLHKNGWGAVQGLSRLFLALTMVFNWVKIWGRI